MGPTPEQIEQIITQQVKLKRNPDDIFKMAQRAGIPAPEITSVFMNMGLPIPSFTNLNQASSKARNTNQEDFEGEKNISKNKIWDPIGQEIKPEVFNKINQRVQKKIDRFLANPKIAIRNLLIASIPGIIALGFFIFSFDGIFEQIGNLKPVEDSENKVQAFSNLNIQWIFFAFFPAMLYWAFVSNFQRDSIKLMVAQKKGWIYNSGSSRDKWEIFAKFLPEIFNKGGHSHQIEDEFWGSVDGEDFYASNFKFVRGSGKQKKTYYYNVFALKLPAKNMANFQLQNKKPYQWNFLENFFGPKKIDMESVEFNKNFKVFYQDSDDSNQDLEITKTLSPAVQEALIKFKQEHQIENIIFRDGKIFFQFYGRMLPKIYTNFFRDMKLDERDFNAVENKILKIMDVSKGIMKYLD